MPHDKKWINSEGKMIYPDWKCLICGKENPWTSPGKNSNIPQHLRTHDETKKFESFSTGQVQFFYFFDCFDRNLTDILDIVNSLSVNLRQNRIHAIMSNNGKKKVKGAVSIVPTRWNSRCFQLNRLLELLYDKHLSFLVPNLGTKKTKDQQLATDLESFSFSQKKSFNFV